MTAGSDEGAGEAVLTRPGPVWRITFNRPEARNAVSAALLEGLTRALARAAEDPDCRVVVLDGAGPDFCAGADVGELARARTSRDPRAYGAAFERGLRAIEEQPQPVLAAIHGAALGAGCQFAVAADLAVAADDARLGIPSARLGIVIGHENVERLVAAVGPKRAAAVLLAGRTLDGTEAAAWGLVNEVVPAADLQSRVFELAEAVAALAPLSVRASKRGIRNAARGLGPGPTGGARVEGFDRLADAAFASEDLAEGLAAFRERRPPVFRGR